MTLNSNAIITVTDAKAFLKVENDLENSLIEMLINNASDQIEYERNTCIKAKDLVDEIYSGEGDSFIVLRNYPINSLTDVKIDGQSIPLTEFTYVSGTGTLHYNGTFPKGYGTVKVTYNAGYTNIPGRYRTWCLQLVSDYYEGRGGDL